MHSRGKAQVFRGSLLRGPAAGVFLLLLLAMVFVSVVCTYSAARWINAPFPGFLLNQRMALSNIGHYSWTGTEAGLSYPDRILTADERQISTIGDLREVVAGKGVGEAVHYRVERSGETVEVSVSTMIFTFMDFMIAVGNYLVTCLIYLVLGVVVILLKPDSRASRAFFLACYFLSLNDVTNMDLVSSHLGFTWLYMLTGIFVPAAGFHLAMLFPEEKGFVRKRPSVQLLPYAVAAAVAVPVEYLYPAPAAVRIYSTFVPLFGLAAALFLTISVLRSFTRGVSALVRQRAKVVLFGVAVAFPLPAIGMVLSNMGVTIGGVSILNNFFFFPFLLFPASIAYAITKHNLFDVDVYIKRAVGYGLMTGIVGGGYVALQLLLGPTVLRPIVGDMAEKFYAVLFALLVVFLFNPINRRVQEAVDKLFYRKKYDYRETVTAMGNALTSILDLDEIIKRIIHTVRNVMYIDNAGVILLGHSTPECRAVIVEDVPGSDESRIKERCLSHDDALVALLTREKKLVTEYDIAEGMSYQDVRKPVGRRFRELSTSMAVPITYQNELTGILTLGQKKSGHFFTRDDIRLLETLANHGAVAIENAKMAEQMQREQVVRTNLTRYLSPQFVDRVMSDDMKVDLGGDRKAVTVLFSDIRNFTSITETRPPDQLVSVLNEYFTEMAKSIFDNRGSIDKYIGDAIMAVFGSLIALEKPAINAVRAAIQMMKDLPALNERWKGRYDDFNVDIGIGITTGEVFLGNIGSPERMEYTVIGDAVNVASRFSGLAKAGQILVTRETLDMLGGEFSFREHPPTAVKGKSEKLEVFEILYS